VKLEEKQIVKILAIPAGDYFTQEEKEDLLKNSPITHSAVIAKLDGWKLQAFVIAPQALSNLLIDYGCVELMELVDKPGLHEFFWQKDKLVTAGGFVPERKRYPSLNLSVRLYDTVRGVEVPPPCPDRCLVVNCRTNKNWTCGLLDEDAMVQVRQGISGEETKTQLLSRQDFWATMGKEHNGSVLIVEGANWSLAEIFAEIPKLELPDFMRKLHTMKDLTFDPFEL
jgi:hypothetical protein